MTKDYLECYEVLGLTPGATSDDIKRAYFQLVRRHPPEKDPEQFQKIRHAYEVLKAGPPKVDTEAFPQPDDPMVRYWLGHANRLMKEGNDKAAADCIAEALTIEPGDPFLLLNLARMQLRADNPRKAAKTAQKLLELKPDFAQAHALAADGMYDGGWYKKALPEYRKAYELGWRKFEFLLNYADAAEANGQGEEAANLRTELLRNTKWGKENREEAIYLYARQIEHCSFDDDRLLAALKEYEAFFRENRRLLRDLGTRTAAPLYPLTVWGSSLSQEAYLALDTLLGSIAKQNPEAGEENLRQARLNMVMERLEEDDEFSDTLWMELAATICEEEEDADYKRMQRYGLLDAIMCLNSERETTFRQLPRLWEKYPFLYEVREPLSAFFADDSEQQLEKLRREYDRLCEEYSGGEFYKRHPEEKKLPRGTLAYAGDTPFVRETKKPGRNDPCPCGSGKKFKKCCLGKGIYD